jgi:hypothetical protein
MGCLCESADLESVPFISLGSSGFLSLLTLWARPDISLPCSPSYFARIGSLPHHIITNVRQGNETQALHDWLSPERMATNQFLC